jgi:MFS family permease
VGATEVALPAFAADVASAAVAGVLLALWSVGSAAGGLTYGARSAGDRPDHSYVRLALLLPLTCLPLIGAWSLAAMVVLVMIAGVGIAPLMSASNHLVGELAPPGTVTEAYAWPITALALGVAAGNAAAGAIIDAEGWRAAFAVAAGGAAATPLLAVSRRRTLTTS